MAAARFHYSLIQRLAISTGKITLKKEILESACGYFPLTIQTLHD
jgi:hypothetical protein